MFLKNIHRQIAKERQEKPLMKFIMFWGITSLVIISVIKTVLRPRHYHFSEIFDFLLDTLPNFFAGAAIFVFGFLFYIAIFKNNYTVLRRFLFSSVFSFCSLTIWEIIQYFMGYPIDVFDIIMTVAGIITSIAVTLIPGINYFEKGD